MLKAASVLHVRAVKGDWPGVFLLALAACAGLSGCALRLEGQQGDRAILGLAQVSTRTHSTERGHARQFTLVTAPLELTFGTGGLEFNLGYKRLVQTDLSSAEPGTFSQRAFALRLGTGTKGAVWRFGLILPRGGGGEVLGDHQLEQRAGAAFRIGNDPFVRMGASQTAVTTIYDDSVALTVVGAGRSDFMILEE